MLADPRHAGWTVSAIALEAGFGDVSYFNRRFRRRFGAPPTHFRSWNGEADGL
jgi:AraC-like DNA-binding protein